MIAPRRLPPVVFDTGPSLTRMTSASVAVLAAGLVVGLTLVRGSHMSPAGAVAGVVLSLVAVALVIEAVLRRPSGLSLGRLWVVLSLAVVASALEYLSSSRNDDLVRDDYGAVLVGLLLLAAAPFCGALALVMASVLAVVMVDAVILGTVVLIPGHDSRFVPVMLLLRSTVMLTLAVAAAAYSRAAVSVELRRRQLLNHSVLRRDAQIRASFGRDVPQTRAGLLRDEVLPFLAEIVGRDQLTKHDAVQARVLAEALQYQSRVSSEATWVDDLSVRLMAARDVRVAVDDPARAAELVDHGRRAALAGVIAWSADVRRSTGVRIRFDRAAAPGDPNVEVCVSFDTAASVAEPPTDAEVERATAVLRALSAQLRWSRRGETVFIGLSIAPTPSSSHDAETSTT